MKFIYPFLLVTILLIVFSANLNAQVKVNLVLDESKESIRRGFLFCDKDENCGLFANEQSKTMEFGQEKIQFKVWREGQNFYLQIDKNLDGKLTDDEKLLLTNGSSVAVELKRRTESGKIIILPYQIYHKRYEDNGSIVDNFSISSHYSFVGTLTYKNCSSAIAFSDFNLNGSADFKDSIGGTNLGIDVNNDGKIWGKDEYKKSSQVINFCGQNFTISAINNNVATFLPSALTVAKVGEAAPEFSFTLLNNQTLDTEKLKGKYYVLDFWASYCVPCVNNLARLATIEKKYQDKISIYSINVDDASKKTLAEKIIGSKQIADYSSIRGMGEDDVFWKTFGSNEVSRLFIPLYVVVDKNGIVKYMGKGGEDLSELKTNIDKVLATK